MERFRQHIQKHKGVAWSVTLAYIIFQGCFAFPFANELFPFNYSKAVIIVIGYGLIGMCFAGIYDKRKGLMVLLFSFVFTIIGLLCRFALEYGEVSNEMNFTPLNIFLYLTIIPLYCGAVYWCIHKFDTAANG